MPGYAGMDCNGQQGEMMNHNPGTEWGRVTNAAELGDVFRRRRRQLNQSQERLAELLGTHRNRLAELEKGTPTERVALLFDALNELGLELVVRPRNVHRGFAG
jgi:DNA-binding XRE family transcriptional regulator